MTLTITAADVRLEALSKHFGRNIVAVDDFSLTVEHGTLVTLLGPSGCGKTTTLRMVGGLEYPTAGRIYVGNDDITDRPAYDRDITMMFQSYALFPHMTVFENVAYGLQVSKSLNRDEIAPRVHAGLDKVQLRGLDKRRIDELSGGQQQRVALARSIVVEPKVLLFDEPLSNLDAKLRKGTREQIRQLQQDLEITSLYVTHDQAEAMSISDEIAIMHKGRLQQLGTAEEIYAQPANSFVASFIGEANLLLGTCRGGEGQTLNVELYGKMLQIKQDPNQFSSGEQVNVVVRPEVIDIVESGNGETNAKIRFSHYTGSIVLYSMILPDGTEMLVQTTNPLETGFIDVGSEVGLELHRSSLHVVKAE